MEHTKRNREIADSFKARCSSLIEILGGTIGLTETQSLRKDELLTRAEGYKNGTVGVKDLTDNMKAELSDLLIKEKNTDLPEGLKTHCKKWLKKALYGREEQLKNKYVSKGNKAEEDGFTLMAVVLNLGMVYKNTERRSNSYLEGECDLHLVESMEDFERDISVHIRRTYDNKCAWDLSTFPMFETEHGNQRYENQLQGYNILWPSDELHLCYTLIDTPEEEIKKAISWESDQDEKYRICERLCFTEKWFNQMKEDYFPLSTLDTFKEIPEEFRVKSFPIKPDNSISEKVEKRVDLCREYIFQLLEGMTSK